MDIPDLELVYHVSSYALLVYVGFDTDKYDGVAKTRSAILLRYIVHLHQRTKNPLNYVHSNSKYGHIVAIPDSDTQELF